MILFVDLEHDHLQHDPSLWIQSRARVQMIRQRLEEISGEPCLVLRYDEVGPNQVDELSPRAVAVSGCTTDYDHYDPASLSGLRAVYKQAAIPIIGFCAGMQLMVETHGATLGPIGKTTTPAPSLPYSPTPYPPDMIQETGFLPVEITAPKHPLVAGLPTTPVVFQAHYWEVKDLPAVFQNLANSPITPIQIIVHRTLPLFGTQFHTEQYNDENLDGRKILENFFQIALSF